MKKIVLASGSYLKQLVLKKANLKFIIDVPNIDEKVFENIPIEKRVKQLSYIKCQKIALKYIDTIVIAADTLIVMDNVVYGKPANINMAYEMAIKCSGKTITAFTGITICSPDKKYYTEISKTSVSYQKFSKDDLIPLFRHKIPTRMATGLGFFIDAPGFSLVKSIKGSYSGAYGLPMEIVNKYLGIWR